jgi:hypothetical protein
MRRLSLITPVTLALLQVPRTLFAQAAAGAEPNPVGVFLTYLPLILLIGLYCLPAVVMIWYVVSRVRKAERQRDRIEQLLEEIASNQKP